MRRRWLGTMGLGTLALVPLLAACGSGDTKPEAEKAADGRAWVVVTSGSATPSPVVTGAKSTATPFPTGYLPLPTTSPTPTPTGTPTCPPNKRNPINGATAVAGATSATVSWFHGSAENLVDYRVTAISQDAMLGEQRDIGWTVVTPGAECSTMTATVTGLDRGTRYVFSVDAVSTRRGFDGTYSKTVARSGVVTTTG
ncbi:fibronectin type III domain-containing protein [Actinoplanes sp. NPDC049596]|uniref:fibronectin type III domain-containing protein n=1 Tax=unclassified Actinoplanes TaxID=2626549 RepID=UPI00342741D3